MSAFIYTTDNLVTVISPYNADFIGRARLAGGNWNREIKAWQFRADHGHTEASVAQHVQRFYETITFGTPPAPAADASQHVGTVSKKLENVAVTIERVTVLNDQYGTTWFHKMRTPEGNLLVWYASKSQNLNAGDAVQVTGTVKRHDTYKNVAQTVLTRCKITRA